MNLPVNNSVPQVCKRLRTKQAFMHSATEPAWQEGKSTTAAYWCLRTMSPAGPDEAFVHPRDCKAGRGCYENVE
ncbi:MAG TPA: hypothetical protein VGG19_19545 [Tepidisphaeraceae bacterium]|jgi:hypothetical protein